MVNHDLTESDSRLERDWKLFTALTFLFSYEALRDLSQYYASKPGIANALAAKLNAAEDAEQRHNASARAGQLNAFRNDVKAQSGKALTAQQAHVLSVMSMTL